MPERFTLDPFPHERLRNHFRIRIVRCRAEVKPIYDCFARDPPIPDLCFGENMLKFARGSIGHRNEPGRVPYRFEQTRQQKGFIVAIPRAKLQGNIRGLQRFNVADILQVSNRIPDEIKACSRFGDEIPVCERFAYVAGFTANGGIDAVFPANPRHQSKGGAGSSRSARDRLQGLTRRIC